MRWLLFLARVAFICNLFFFVCVLILFTKDFIQIEFFETIVILLGWFLSFPINFGVNATEIILVLSRKPSPTFDWLRIFNFVAFILQILIHFFIPHGTLHT
jgi:hypothetical protein